MICENIKCGKEHDGSFGSGRFCSKKCAATFSGKFNLHTNLKKATCPKCGESHLIKLNAVAKSTLCDSCKKIRSKKIKHCKICGQIICPQPNICSKRQIFKGLIKYLGFDQSKIGTLQVYDEFERIRKILEKEYLVDKLSTLDLGKKYGYKSNGANFNDILNYFDIKRRGFAEAVHNALLQGKNILPYQRTQNSKMPFKNGWYTTWMQDQIFYRSNYELKYFQKLDQQKIPYKVEAFRIKYWDSQLSKFRIAVPDIYLPESHKIIEIKSIFTYDKQNMVDRSNEYLKLGYDFTLILDQKEFTSCNLPDNSQKNMTFILNNRRGVE